MDVLLIFLGPLLSFSIVVMLMGKFFELADVDRKKALIPILNVITLLRIIKKKPFLVLILLIPYVNLVMIIWLVTEVLKVYSKRSTLEQVLGIFFGYIYLPYLNFAGKIEYSTEKPMTRSALKEWVDALIFAVAAATLIRMFVFEAYTIPSSSMESSLMVGDFLFVSKFHYGPRVPNTPLSVPFTHQGFPEWIPIIGGAKPYLKAPQLPYYRLPGFRDIERYDNVVFNYPADSPDYPVDKKTNYIKRCVGLPGDSLEVINAELFVNGEKAWQPEKMQISYLVKYKPYKGQEIPFSQLMQQAMTIYQNGTVDKNKKFIEYFEDVKHQLTELDINLEDINALAHSLDRYTLRYKDEAFMNAFINLPFIDTIQPFIKGPKESPMGGQIYPFEFARRPYTWNMDYYGPIYIPKKGSTIKLNDHNFEIYKMAIQRYEGHNFVKSPDGRFLLDGEAVTEYTFKMDYYFMMGDNRHNSADSRAWGFVPEDHIVGKAWLIWLSLDKYKSWFDGKLRWRRIFKPV